MKPAEFLAALWGTPPPGLIQLWCLHGRRSYYLRHPGGAAALAAAHPRDLYTGVALAATDHGRSHRARADQAAAIAGLWLDIDVNGGPDAKTGAAPDLDTAIALADARRAPTILVHSGYGLQAWWLFEKPWRFASRGEQHAAATAAAQWHALHRAKAGERGFGLDAAHDLARLLRLPGTINAKGEGSAPVTVLAEGRRHDRRDLLALAATAGPVEVGRPGGASDAEGPVLDVAVRAGAAPPTALFEALRANSAEFAVTWAHARRERPDWTLSEYDLALCSLAAGAGWTDQQLADLIALHRRAYDPSDTKAERADYIRRTVTKARSGAEQAQDLDWFRQAAKPRQEALA